MWTALVSLCLAAGVQAPTDNEKVFAWVLGDPGAESSRLVPLLVLEDLDPDAIAARLADAAPGRRGLVSRSLLEMLASDPSDHVVVAGRITDHPGPWLDAGIARATRELEAVAVGVFATSQAVDLLLLGGENPIAAAALDTTDDLVWIAIRNDSRFDDIGSPDLTLEGAMSPSSAQWAMWNTFADATISNAVESSLASLRKASPEMVVVCPAAGRGHVSDGVGAWAVALGVREGAQGSGASTFHQARAQVEDAIARRAEGIPVMPRVIPRSHPGSSERRSFVTGTVLWDELVRHGLLLGGGNVIYVDDRATAGAADAQRFVEILDATAAEAWTDVAFGATEREWRFQSGAGYFASGVGSADGEIVWRVTFAPGFGELAVVIDGTPTTVQREDGQSGGWFVHETTITPEFPEFADRGPQFAGPGRTGDGLVPADGGRRASVANGSSSNGPTDVSTGPGNPNAGALGYTNQDLNGDGVVDGADQTIWLSGGAYDDTDGGAFQDDPAVFQGSSGALAGRDLNGDGVVDGADLAIRLAARRQRDSTASTSDIDLQIKQSIENPATTGEGGSEPDWNDLGVGDLNGDGVIDGIDLAMSLAGQGGGEVSNGEGDDGDGDPQTDGEGSEGAGSTSTDPGAPPEVDPTLPIGDGEGGETPPTQNPEVAILYDGLPNAAIGAALQTDGFQSYIIVYEGVDPDARTSGQIDADRVVQHVRSKYGESPSGYGVLDFENPFLERISAGPEDPHYQSTVNTIVALLDRVRAEFPNVKWTMYGMPRIKYWGPPGSYGWATASDEGREELLSAALAAFQPVIERCEWMNPSVYDRYELERQNEPSWTMWTNRETAWRQYTVNLCHRINESIGGPAKPIIPMVSPLFFKVGQIEYNMKYMETEELLRDQIRPCMEAGANGVAFWTGYNFWTHAATSDEDLGWHQEDARAAMGQDYFEQPPGTWADPVLRLDLQQRVSERVRDSMHAGRQEAQSILNSQMAGVPES